MLLTVVAEPAPVFRVKVSGYQVEYAKKLAKGSRVMVMGRLDISHYTSRDNEARTGFDVWADEVVGMGSRPDNNNGRQDETSATSGGRQRPAAAEEASDLNDLPF